MGYYQFILHIDRYVRHLDLTVLAIHIKTKLCQLVEAMMKRTDDLAFRQEMKFRNKLVEYLTDWVMGTSHRIAPPGSGDVTVIIRYDSIASEDYWVFDQRISSVGWPYLLFWSTGFSLEPWKWCNRAGPVQIPDMPFWDKAVFRWSCTWFGFIKRTHFVKREAVLANSIRNYLINFITRLLVTDGGHAVTQSHLYMSCWNWFSMFLLLCDNFRCP